jgi:hypothetical protein
VFQSFVEEGGDLADSAMDGSYMGIGCIVLADDLTPGNENPRDSRFQKPEVKIVLESEHAV